MIRILKNTNGITIIMLVITIIVLLILAGVSIVSLTSDNGLIEETKKSKETAESESLETKIKAEIMEISMLNNGKLNYIELAEKLKKSIDNLEILNSDSNFPMTVKINEYTFDITAEGEINLKNNY